VLRNSLTCANFAGIFSKNTRTTEINTRTMPAKGAFFYAKDDQTII
jgi:hypothetical protein